MVNGVGSFTPGRVVDSTQVLLPLSFGDFGFRAEVPGQPTFEEVVLGEAESKGKGNVAKRNPRPTTRCTFEASEVLEEAMEGFPAGTRLTFSGYVVVQIAGAR